ncbi:MAG: hypothetical protein K9K88_11115 [Desulfobacterales bacterium]|nr:hypothetical protein [Desulfobacterales bacterium]
MDVKSSTKDCDFIVPAQLEYAYLIRVLKDLDYKQVTGWGWNKNGDPFIYDLFPGKKIHTTELLENPLLPGHHSLFKEFSQLYVEILNEYDLIASKLFRGTEVDVDDCLTLLKARKQGIDIQLLEKHARELASYDVGELRVLGQIDRFMELLKEEKLYD